MKHLSVFLLIVPAICFSQHFSTTTFALKPFPLLPKPDKVIMEILIQNNEFANLSSDRQEWFYWTNLSRQKPKFFYDSVVQPILKTYPELESNYTRSVKTDLTNIGQLPFIMPNKKLLVIAQSHADDLAKHKNSPSHSSTNGQTFQQRMIKNDVNRCAAENITYGPNNTVMALVLLFIDEGLPDLGHRKNLLCPTYVEMGVGIARYPNNFVLAVQDFACSQTL